MRVAHLSISTLAIWLAACNNLPTRVDRPAVIATQTPESLAEVTGVLEQALGPREIRLAPDVLTRSSILTLEQGAGLDRAATGRVLEMPERFELVLNGNRCFLVHARTQDRWPLERSDCVPADP